MMVMMNASHVDVDFVVPGKEGSGWKVVLDTSSDDESEVMPGDTRKVPARSLLVLEGNG